MLFTVKLMDTSEELMLNFLRSILVPTAVVIFLLSFIPGAMADVSTPEDAPETGTSISSEEDQKAKWEQLLSVSLRSPNFEKTPVALVNESPITLGEILETADPAKVEHARSHGRELEYYRDVLQRLINSRLVVLEAKNIGLDETAAVQAKIEAYKTQTLLRQLIQNHIADLQADPDDVEELYQKMSREVLLYSLIFKKAPLAKQFLEEVKEEDFDTVAKRYIEEDKVETDNDEKYVKIKELKPKVGEVVYSMQKGEISKIFMVDQGFLVFRLADARFVEDEAIRQNASAIILLGLKKQKALEYGQELTEKYVTFDEELYEQLDFDQDFEKLKNDQRPLATLKQDPSRKITVADLARKLASNIFHGTEKAQKLKLVNKRKKVEITNMLFKLTGILEAKRLGLDKTEEFMEMMNNYKRSVLFETFMSKVVLPDVKLTAEKVRSYYEEHIDDYSSPAMLLMKSMVFHERSDAENALEKLNKGADYSWVSANATGFVSPDNEKVMPFDSKLLSLTALPEDLQEKAADAKKGDALLYEGEDGFVYVLVMQDVFPPEPRPYEEARDAVAKTVYEKTAQQLIEEWTSKLKEAYSVKIFLVDTKEKKKDGKKRDSIL